MTTPRLVLAYSGGLDTSVAIPWIKQHYGYDVIALTIDVGNEPDMDAIMAKARQVGAVEAVAIDARADFLSYFVWPALRAGALYQGVYPLATALSRPLISKLLVDVAREHGATAVAHGCTGKGNDQVRFDLSVAALAPDLKIVAPVREWGMTREEEIAYAEANGIPVPVTRSSPYSIDANLWGRSAEAGVLEDPWQEPPADVYAWTRDPGDAPAEPRYLEIAFERGIPVALDGEPIDPVPFVEMLTRVGGEHGVGRIDHIEDRLVGIKSREIYETPAAIILHAAHAAVESMTLSRDQLRTKAMLAPVYAELIYNGLWYSALHQDLAAFVQSTQRFVTGTARVKLHRGNCTVVGRQAERPLYDLSLATYDAGDRFDQSAAPGFIALFGQQMKTQAGAQLLPSGQDPLRLAGNGG